MTGRSTEVSTFLRRYTHFTYSSYGNGLGDVDAVELKSRDLKSQRIESGLAPAKETRFENREPSGEGTWR